MDFSFFIQGIIIGLTLAVPVGPIALICIQRTLTDGRFHGIFSGIGVATADSFYAAVTVLGLTMISSVIVTHQFLFRFLARDSPDFCRYAGFHVTAVVRLHKDRARDVF